MAKHMHPTFPKTYPLSYTRVVTQRGSWLVMELVSHPASINLTPQPSAQLTPPLSYDQMAQGKHQGSGSSRRGLGRQVAKWEPYFIHTLCCGSPFSKNTHGYTGLCANICRCVNTHGCSHMVWSSRTISISAMIGMWDFMVSVIVEILH